MQAVLLLVALTAMQAARAVEPVPDAGMLRQQIEQRRMPELPVRPPAPEPLQVPEGSGLSVTVKAFRFAGNTLLDEATLQAVAEPYLNRPLDFAQLQEVAAAVGRAYREAGWIVRTYLPRQEIEEGIITIQIIEAVFGGARFEGPVPARIAVEDILAHMQRAQATGKPLSARGVDRALLLLSDLPGAAISGNLTAGRGESETDMVFSATDKPLLSGSASSDNTGSRSTGRTQVSASLDLNSPLKLGDRLSLNLLHSEGSDYARLAYSLPLGHDGWRLGVSASDMRYRLVTEAFEALDVEGASTTAGAEIGYPLLRSRLANLSLSLAAEHKRYDNSAAGATTTRYRIDNATLGLSGNLLDRLGGGGMNAFSLQLTAGDADLDGSPNAAADALTTRTAGRFDKLRYNLSRLQTLNETFSAYAAFSGQAASKNLDSAEKFYLGGAGGIRAYPSGEGGGASGRMLNLELRARLPANLGITAFYDWGRISVNQHNDFPGAPALNSYALKGAGLSLGWTAPLGLDLRATWARRIGDNPNALPDGRDQDGTELRDRLWVQAWLPF